MFRKPLDSYRYLITEIFCGPDSTRPRPRGLGCVLSPSHCLTARHVVRSNNSAFVGFWKHDGFFNAEALHESEELDLILLKAGARLQADDKDEPIYPVLSGSPPAFGEDVGYLAKIRFREDGDMQSHWCFSRAVVSGDAGNRLFLAGGIIQGGFSGTPVFGAEAQLYGVITSSWTFPQDPLPPNPNDLPNLMTYSLARMSPLREFAETIAAAVSPPTPPL